MEDLHGALDLLVKFRKAYNNKIKGPDILKDAQSVAGKQIIYPK